MTREEYLSQLKNNILSLTVDEQSEALQYYSDYFDEANDDEKVIKELGSPEELAKTIIEKFANVPVETKTKSEDSEKSDSNGANVQNALYFEYKASAVKGLAFSFGAAQVVAIPGKKFSVETRGISKENLSCSLGADGILTINNTKKINLNFWSHERRNRIVPRILLTVPENAKLENVRLSIDAGSFSAKEIALNYETARFDVGAGNLVLNSVCGGKTDFRCGMGNLSINGKVTGNCNIDCGMGSVKLNLKGDKNLYSYDAKIGLGDFKFNSEKRSGFCQVLDVEKKENHFSVNCGMGSVIIKMED